MKNQVQSLLPVVALVVGAGIASAAARPVADASVPFAFTVSGTSLPAGKYEVLVEDSTQNTLMLRNVEGGKDTVVPFTTRLAMREDGHDMLVFDKAGEQYFLSEVHIAGSDGYLVPGASARHTHAQVRVIKKNR